ncbi:hypothetical protein BN59_03811 [Legionella massiliensis]|uniref:Uncharacterized protein n=1 Tax=Legionella massiliensis TaxID=1034943 RepID=A0A078L6G3_9GAMM|nr:hypothetical protein [Legionella massiliensis]CDZ79493.1 hypothetical protein BN59_03811 [Legionella massiliensis]CEE15231.1 hypothetical protein BN1094_03811 [Legionella massiliensis]
MATTSQDIFKAVLGKAFENPHSRPNILLVSELPEKIHRETYYIIQKKDSPLEIVYVTDTLNSNELQIKDETEFLQEVLSLLKGKNEARLSKNDLASLMRQYSPHPHFRFR